VIFVRYSFFLVNSVYETLAKLGLPRCRFQARLIAFTCVFVSASEFPNLLENPRIFAHRVTVDKEQPISSAACFAVIMVELYAIARLIANAVMFESGRVASSLENAGN
jgi:hypothetical protein